MNSTQKPPLERLREVEWARRSSHVQAVEPGWVDEKRPLRLTIAKLEEERRRNSSQPPSQDKAVQKPSPEAAGRSARRRGGQPGHGGRGRALVPVEAEDEGSCIER